MLKDAASKAKPTKYVQNRCHGMYEGTSGMMSPASERCSAPKTANGSAKHKLLKTTILSRPRTCAMSLFTAHSAIRRTTMAAPPIEAGMRENSRNMARIVGCIGDTRRKLASAARALSPARCGAADCTTEDLLRISACDRLMFEADERPDFACRLTFRRTGLGSVSWRSLAVSV